MRTRNSLSDPRGITQVWTDWPPSGSESSRGWFAKGGGTPENMSSLVRGNESWYDCTNANANRNDKSIKSIDSLFTQKMIEVSNLLIVIFWEIVFSKLGDALFFHCNLLHHSSDNNSDMRRWVYICTYNKASNNPTLEHHHPRYTPLKKVCATAQFK